MQDDTEIPFTEDDYRRRKPHPNFKEHISAEKVVIKFGKTVRTVTSSVKLDSVNSTQYLVSTASWGETQVCLEAERNKKYIACFQDVFILLEIIKSSARLFAEV